jgi:hypothetical protein
MGADFYDPYYDYVEIEQPAPSDDDIDCIEYDLELQVLEAYIDGDLFDVAERYTARWWELFRMALSFDYSENDEGRIIRMREDIQADVIRENYPQYFTDTSAA